MIYARGRSVKYERNGHLMKTKLITGILIITAVALVSGATFLAMAAPGSPDNPFVTLSYLNDSFRPQIMSEINAAEAELAFVIDTKIAEFEARLEDEYGDYVRPPDSAEKFDVITLSGGQSMICSIGTEIMLRVGEATGFGASPALINYTGGETLADGAGLTINNMYLVTIEGNGITAAAETVRVLVRGSYSIAN